MASPGVVAGVVAGILAVLLLAGVTFATGLVGMGFAEGALILVILLVVLGGLVVTVAAVVHALVRDDLAGVQRLAWLAIVVFVPFGALVYLLLGRRRTAAMFRDVAAPAAGSSPGSPR
ncbi:MAG TPA: PLDc N-terminal domain-containing protein [Candidatus Thermoplasmatota archaeon]|nr:PLDc N-terminal domain-containing protein [Candidatus Thermoplasmatota archaeon]